MIFLLRHGDLEVLDPIETKKQADATGPHRAPRAPPAPPKHRDPVKDGCIRA